jgi:hypothetical protein
MEEVKQEKEELEKELRKKQRGKTKFQINPSTNG